MFLSSTLIVVELMVVVVPLTVRSPAIVKPAPTVIPPVRAIVPSEMLLSRATDTSLVLIVVVTLVPPDTVRVSPVEIVSSDPESPPTVRSVEIEAVEALVIRPFASIARTGIAVVDPYELADTPESAKSRVTAAVSEPEPVTVRFPDPESATVAT